MSTLDWGVLAAALVLFVAHGFWHGRRTRDLGGFLLANRSLSAPVVLLSVMATQASAITFLSTPGQGYADGLRFVQFYFGLPLAMVVLCFTAVPAFHGLGVYTAYEFLERRFDRRTRLVGAGLFLVQRGLGAGLTLYAPALVLSVLLGWEVRTTCVLLGALAVAYTAWGGARSVGHAHALQFVVIIGAMALAFALLVRDFPAGVGWGDALALAGRIGKLNAIDTHFDLNERYNLWSGIIGGFFLQLAYFGTDQSQVGRYLGGQSVRASRIGLLANGALKIPMQAAILFLGVMLAVHDLFVPTPLSFDPPTAARLASSAHAGEWRALAAEHAAAETNVGAAAHALVAARHAHDPAAGAAAAAQLAAARAADGRVRDAAHALVRRAAPGAPASDTNEIFLVFVLHALPAGVVGLVLAAIFAASMNASSSELNALASTTLVDLVHGARGSGARAGDVALSRWLTLGWAAFAILFASWASRLGTLVEAVNVLGSLFYGTLLGLFVCAFTLPIVRGRDVIAGAIAGEACVLACFRFGHVSFLWYNVLGCAVVVLVALGSALLTRLGARRARA